MKHEKTLENFRRFARASRPAPGTRTTAVVRISPLEAKAAWKVLDKVQDESLRKRAKVMLGNGSKYEALEMLLSEPMLGGSHPAEALELAEAVAGLDFDQNAALRLQ